MEKKSRYLNGQLYILSIMHCCQVFSCLSYKSKFPEQRRLEAADTLAVSPHEHEMSQNGKGVEFIFGTIKLSYSVMVFLLGLSILL